jgi:RNA-directed DNA polymerase
MQTYNDLYTKLCSYDNLELAWKRARKRKTLKDYVIEFETNLANSLSQLKYELETFTYRPSPLTTFIVRDPKTRRISASHFRDRVIHHAVCNIVEPILSKDFIYDSFANQKGKGTHLAIKRVEKFMKKVAFRARTGGAIKIISK